MKIGDRIKQARQSIGVSQPKLAELCGWDSQSRISQYENGKREPVLEDIRRLSKATGVSFGWLATGENDSDGTLSQEEQALIDNYRHSDERGQKMIRGIAATQSTYIEESNNG